jgi:integrase
VAHFGLTDAIIKQAKPGAKPVKLSDGRGLYLLVQPSGSKLWRLRYKITGADRKLSLGTYPEVSLKLARERSVAARFKLANGVDPGEEKRAAATVAKIGASNTFRAIADEYLEKSTKEGRADVTIGKSRWLLSLIDRDIGGKPVADITPAQLLAALKKIEAKGHLETARRARSLAGRVFRYAVATARATGDPSAVLKGALITPTVKHHSAIVHPEEVGALMRAIDGYSGAPLTLLALQLTPHLFVRPGELRRAEWSEFDFTHKIWTIPAAKMKMRAPHLVPLSSQAVAILDAAHALSGAHRYVFSSLYPGSRPMSENTINAALRRIGYTGGEMTAHGFRAMASTLLNESGKWSADAIERGLAHKDSSVRGDYHRGTHWNERVKMAQWWSDYLFDLRDGITRDYDGKTSKLPMSRGS